MKKLLNIIVAFVILISIMEVSATTLKETTDSSDEYDTILPNTFIIGVTKFPGNEIITAGKAVTAGANDALHYITLHQNVSLHEKPVVYLYLGPEIGWFSIDKDNTATAVVDKDLLERLSSQDIYYVSNKEKNIVNE